MLIFNPKRMINLRGLVKPHAALVKAGLAPATATNLLNYYNTRITLKHVERICEMLHCTPNDLLDWNPDEHSTLRENHPLYTLQRTEKLSNLREMLKDMPVEKLSELESIVAEMKKQ
jgi:DNA-binding Xre family transcriptional regulator